MVSHSRMSALTTGVALVLLSARSSCFTSLSPSLRGQLRQPGKATEPISEVPRASSDAPGGDSIGASGIFGVALGVAVVGAAAKSRRRNRDVSLDAYARPATGSYTGKYKRSYQWIYGSPDEHPDPKLPDWINPQSKNFGVWKQDKKEEKVTVPAWLTEQKWLSLTRKDRCRHPSWLLKYFDKDGNPAFDRRSVYTISEAIDILQGMVERAPSEHIRSVDVFMNMNLDQKFPNQQVRVSLKLPHGNGKTQRVAVFCAPEEEEEVLKLGAVSAGLPLMNDIEADKIDFDILITKPQMMPRLAKLGRILGPRKLMPSPKSGTVVQDYAEAIKDFSMGSTVELRTDQDGVVRVGVAAVSMGKQKIMENIKALLQGLADKRPAGAKSKFWTTVHVRYSQCPCIEIAHSEFPRIQVEEDSDDE